MARFANEFVSAHESYFITADSMTYDFGRLAPLDFVFIDGAHDLVHVRSDTQKVYQALRPGGCMVWHDFDSTVRWVEVNKGIEQAGLPETVCHVVGTQVAFLFKQ